jgi:3-carboxy-cis,cis-muconate cycloisomerase
MNFHDAGPTPQTLFSRPNLWQSWLDVEAAMAQAQAEIGMIPQWAADEIASKARLDLFDLDALERSVAETMAPIVSLVRALTELCGEAGGFVHWGGTTQNIMSTGMLLLVRRGHQQMLGHMAGAMDILGAWADEHAETLMAGRTNNRHALPISFGFKVASWIEELSRQNQRFAECEARLFALSFGGAIGAMHSFDGKGDALAKALGRRLALGHVLVPSRASIDTQAEYVASLGLLAMTVGRIGNELYRLMANEIDEVAEQLGDLVIGSSTMPHKVNPKHVVHLISTAAQLRARVAPALEAGMPGHEGDAASNQLMSRTLENACMLGWELAQRLETTLAHIEIRPAAMSANLGRSANVIASENLMMVLAPRIGRTRAHDAVHHAVIEAARDGSGLADILLGQDEIATHIDRDTLERALDPANYLGESATIARQSVSLAASVSNDMRRRLNS